MDLFAHGHLFPAGHTFRLRLLQYEKGVFHQFHALSGAGRQTDPRVRPLVDCVCLFALVAGMGASLGSGVLLLSGGMESMFGIKSQPSTWVVVAAVVVSAFVASAASGVM